MSGYRTLLSMQLYLRLSALKPAHWLPKPLTSPKAWKPVLMGLLFFMVIASTLTSVLWMANGLLSGLMQLGTPELLLSLVVMLIMVLTLIVGFFHITSVLFFSRDSAFLAGLPISSRAVLSARLTVALLGEIALTAAIFLPVCVLYGVRTGQAAQFYLKAVLITPFLPVLPLMAAALLSFLLIRVSSLLRHRDRIAVIGGFLLIAMLLPLQMQLYTFVPQSAGPDFLVKMLGDHQAMIKTLLSGFPPVLWATVGVTGQGIAELLFLLLFMAVSIAAWALPVLVGKGYLPLAIRQGEAFQNVRRRCISDRDLLHRRGVVAAMFVREWREVLRVPAYALNGLVGIVMMPIMMVALYFGASGNGELSALLGQFLRQADGFMITLFGAGAMAFVCCVNTAGATAVSREGKQISFSRMIPVRYASQLLAKHLFGFSINACTCLTTAVTLALLLPGKALYVLAALCMGLLFGFATNAMSLSLDASHPKLDWRNETEAIKQNPMSLLSMALGAAFAAALGFGVFWLLKAGVSLAIAAFLVGAVLVLLALASYVFLMRRADAWFSRIEL